MGVCTGMLPSTHAAPSQHIESQLGADHGGLCHWAGASRLVLPCSWGPQLVHGKVPHSQRCHCGEQLFAMFMFKAYL